MDQSLLRASFIIFTVHHSLCILSSRVCDLALPVIYLCVLLNVHMTMSILTCFHFKLCFKDLIVLFYHKLSSHDHMEPSLFPHPCLLITAFFAFHLFLNVFIIAPLTICSLLHLGNKKLTILKKQCS